MFIRDIVKRLDEEGLLTEASDRMSADEVKDLTYDSRNASEDKLFVCKGVYFKPEYFRSAIEAGTRWYMSETIYESDASYIIVNDIRKALSCVSAMYFGYDKDEIDMTAFVGTKGKTSSVYFLLSILEKAGKKTAYTTTVNNFDGNEVVEGFLTTPESYELHSIIKRAVENGCSDMVMEVSSMAMKMQRIHSITYKYGAFLNISPDHISKFEHKDFDEYFYYKREILRHVENLAVCIDDGHSQVIIDQEGASRNIVTFSAGDTSADICVRDVVKEGLRRRIEVHTPEYDIRMLIPVAGDYNVSNACCAVAVAYMMGIDKKDIVDGIESAVIPGRMETLSYNGYTVIVDYAHNTVSMDSAMRNIRQDYPGMKIKALYGTSGGKVPQRRQDLAYSSGRSAVYCYLTMDNPNMDDPYQIDLEIQHFLDELSCPSEIIVDRKQAIEKAIKELERDEILLITGKGAEHYQVIMGEHVPYEGDTFLADRFLKEYK